MDETRGRKPFSLPTCAERLIRIYIECTSESLVLISTDIEHDRNLEEQLSGVLRKSSVNPLLGIYITKSTPEEL